MMQESARLPPLLTPAWTPPTISSSTVGGGGGGVGKRARGSEVVNGHHAARPRPHTTTLHHHQDPTTHLQSSPGHHPRTIHHQDPSTTTVTTTTTATTTTHLQSLPPARSHGLTTHHTSLPHQSPPLTTHTTITDLPKSHVTHKRISGAVVGASGGILTSPGGGDKGRERWGGWLGGSFTSQRGRSDSTKQCANASPVQTSELRTSGFDMTKLYPELSAKLGLTKHTPNDSTHKNGITLRDSFTSGSLKKLEHVTDDSRIKVVSTGQILNNAKGLLTAKLSNSVQSCKSSNVKSSKSKSKSGEKGQRRGGQSRSGGRIESVSCGAILSSHTQTSISSKASSSSGTSSRSNSTLNHVKNSSSSISASSILEEQLRGGTILRHGGGTSSSGSSTPLHHHHHHHHGRLPHPLPTSPSTRHTPAATSLPAASSGVCGGRSLVMRPASTSTSTTTYPAPLPPPPRVVTLTPRPPPQPSLSSTTAATLPHTLLRVHALREKYYAYNSDLFPLGIETSEESDGSDMEDLCGSQQGWLDPTDGSYDRHTNWSSGGGGGTDDARQKYSDANAAPPHRSVALAVTLSSYRRRIAASRVRSAERAWECDRRGSLTRSLVGAARTHPRLTADACCLYRTPHTPQESPKYKTRFRSAVLQRRECVYDDGEGGGECREVSLPGTRHCIRHIMYNVDQQLFTHCTARHPDNTLCRVPVFDVSHELPLCYKHSKTQENVVKTTPEEISKPKRSRKKNKMPILSRYGKRSKKRRRSSNSTSSVIPSTSVRPPMASQTSSLSSPQPSPTTPQTSPHFSTASYTDSVAEGEESEFEEEMVGMVGDLDVASRLLDRNLQDVLTRIPDHELSQLFDAPEDKTEEFESGGEEKGGEAESEAGDDDDQSVQSTTPAQSPTVAVTTSTSTTALPLNEDANTLSLDENTINELVAGNIPIDSIISSSFNQQELNTISQALSNIVQESNINLAGFDLSTTNSFSETGGSGPTVGDVSDNSLMSQASDGAGQGDFSDVGRPVSECKGNLLTQRPGIVGDATLSPLK